MDWLDLLVTGRMLPETCLKHRRPDACQDKAPSWQAVWTSSAACLKHADIPVSPIAEGVPSMRNGALQRHHLNNMRLFLNLLQAG